MLAKQLEDCSWWTPWPHCWAENTPNTNPAGGRLPWFPGELGFSQRPPRSSLLTETAWLLSQWHWPASVFNLSLCCVVWGVLAPQLWEGRNPITFPLDPNACCLRESPGLKKLLDGRSVRRFSQQASWLTPTFLSPLCVFQSAEFFEMLEKMQVSIYPQGGEPNPGGREGGGGRSAAVTSEDTTPGRTHGQNVGTLEEGAEKRELTVPKARTARGHFHTEWHRGFRPGRR